MSPEFSPGQRVKVDASDDTEASEGTIIKRHDVEGEPGYIVLLDSGIRDLVHAGLLSCVEGLRTENESMPASPQPVQERAKHPGVILEMDFLKPLGLSPEEFAEKLRLPLKRVENLLSGRESMTADLAMRIERLLGTPAKWWLQHQNRYDIQTYSGRSEVEKIKPLTLAEGTLLTPKGVTVWSQRSTPHKAETRSYSKNFVKMLEAQVALKGQKRTPREIEEVTYKNGARALVGKKR